MKNEADDTLDELLRSAQWPDDASDPLNRLLQMAEWPEPVGNSLPDVRRIVRQKKRKKILAAVGAAAAVLLTAAAIRVAWLAVNRAAGGTRPPESLQAKSEVGDQPKATAQLPSRDVRLRTILKQVRERTTAEDDTIDGIVARRLREPDGDLGELVAPLLARRAEFEQRILARFNTFLGKREPAAVELLGWLGSEDSMPLLLRERLKPATHAAAVRSLLNLADARTLARLKWQEWDDDLRDEIAAALQARDDAQTNVSKLFIEGEQSCIDSQSEPWPRADLF